MLFYLLESIKLLYNDFINGYILREVVRMKNLSFSGMESHEYSLVKSDDYENYYDTTSLFQSGYYENVTFQLLLDLQKEQSKLLKMKINHPDMHDYRKFLLNRSYNISRDMAKAIKAVYKLQLHEHPKQDELSDIINKINDEDIRLKEFGMRLKDFDDTMKKIDDAIKDLKSTFERTMIEDSSRDSRMNSK